jgi:VWFA-related protein
MRLRTASLIALGLALSLPALLAAAAQTDDGPAPLVAPHSVDLPQDASQAIVPTLHVTSREIVVDVMVTDANGNAVRGLKQSDFSMKEDGHPQPIRSFREFGAAKPLPAHRLPVLPPNVYTNFQETPATGPVNIILIDALHSNFVGIYHALQGVSQYLNGMPQGTQLAIFWLSESGLHMLQGFTTDPALLRRAVQTLRIDIGSLQDRYAMDRVTIDALNQIAAYVSWIKGRKNLLWFTSGMPVHLIRDGGYSWSSGSSSDRISDSLFMGTSAGPDMGMIHRLMDTYELFSAEQIAVSPIDPGGVVGLGTGQMMAEEVAEQSGGVAYYNNNDLKSLVAEAINDGAHFYTLSYVPPRKKNDGHYHSIKVGLDKPDLHLVYRTGYNSEDPKPPEQFAGPALIKASLEGKAPMATQLLFDATVRPAASTAAAPAPVPAAKHKSKKPVQRTPYDLLYAIPQSQITFADGPDNTHNANLEFALTAYDIYGKFLGRHSQNVTLALTDEKYLRFIQAPLQFHELIYFYPGPLFLRVGVLDGVSNKVGTLEVSVNVQKGSIAPCPPRCPLPKPAPAPATH